VNNGGARGIAVFLGLFTMFIMFGLKLMFYVFTAAVGVVYYAIMGIRWLVRRHQAKVRGEREAALTAATLANPPMPVMNPAK
jgi:UPF0716 family protein affecting phage T7 exclusion